MMSGWANHIEPARGTRRAHICNPAGKESISFANPANCARFLRRSMRTGCSGNNPYAAVKNGAGSAGSDT
jgi:hypothetical protein